MAKNLKLSLIAILSVLGIFQLQAQNINGRGGTFSYLVPSGYGKQLVASGCHNARLFSHIISFPRYIKILLVKIIIDVCYNIIPV